LYHPFKPSLGKLDAQPEVQQALNVNALNFCRFSLAQFPDWQGKGKGKGKAKEALLAVPSLIDSELADIYHLPSMKRMHSSINAPFGSTQGTLDPKGKRTGLIMSLHLRFLDVRLFLAMGFEDGRVELWTCSTEGEGWDYTWDGRISEERRWKRAWEGKKHNEAGQGSLLTIAAAMALMEEPLKNIVQSWLW